MKLHIAVFAAVLVPLSSSALGADRVLVTFTGTVSSITDITDPVGVFSAFSVGNPVTGRYTYGSTLPDTDPNLALGSYKQSYPNAGLWITVGSTEFSPSAGEALEIYVDDNWPVTHDTFSLQIGIPELPACQANANYLIFRDLSDRAISGDALFLEAPNLSAFPVSFGFVFGALCGPYNESVTLKFNVTSVTTEVIVPTVSTWGLVITAALLMGFGTIILRRRRVAS